MQWKKIHLSLLWADPNPFQSPLTITDRDFNFRFSYRLALHALTIGWMSLVNRIWALLRFFCFVTD